MPPTLGTQHGPSHPPGVAAVGLAAAAAHDQDSRQQHQRSPNEDGEQSEQQHVAILGGHLAGQRLRGAGRGEMLCGGDVCFLIWGGGSSGGCCRAAPLRRALPRRPRACCCLHHGNRSPGRGGGAEQHTQREWGWDPPRSAPQLRVSAAAEWGRGGAASWVMAEGRMLPCPSRYPALQPRPELPPHSHRCAQTPIPIPGAAHRAALCRVVPRGRVIVHGPIQPGYVLGRCETKGERGGAGGGGTGRGSCPARPCPAPRS